jgi:hypothetical protein
MIECLRCGCVRRTRALAVWVVEATVYDSVVERERLADVLGRLNRRRPQTDRARAGVAECLRTLADCCEKDPALDNDPAIPVRHGEEWCLARSMNPLLPALRAAGVDHAYHGATR